MECYFHTFQKRSDVIGNCKNIISTLIELGVIESEDDLVTVTDQNSDAEGTVDADY